MDNQLVRQLEMVSAGPLCAPFVRRVAAELAWVESYLDKDAQERLETDVARLLQRQMAASSMAPDGSGGLADTLLEIALRLAPDDGMRH